MGKYAPDVVGVRVHPGSLRAISLLRN